MSSCAARVQPISSFAQLVSVRARVPSLKDLSQVWDNNPQQQDAITTLTPADKAFQSQQKLRHWKARGKQAKYFIPEEKEDQQTVRVDLMSAFSTLTLET